MNLENKKYILNIKNLKENEKPREKLLNSGPEKLTITELIAIILQSGTKKENVLEMSSKIINEYGEKNIIYQKNPKLLSQDINIPQNKACQLIACFEIGKRLFKKNSKPIFIRNSKDAFNYLKDMTLLNKEHLKGLYLNSRYKLVHDETISIGSLNSNLISFREIFKPALLYDAIAVIIAHNHPSGSTKASKDDIITNRKIKEAGRLMEIEVLDHIIIGKNSFSNIPLI
ncbi:DNA repair protein RadC [bacterium]|nr:DNA repair protein RadC [bacterium]